MQNKYGPILGVEQETIIGNVNLASNRDYNQDLWGINKVLLLLNEHEETVNRQSLTNISVQVLFQGNDLDSSFPSAFPNFSHGIPPP